MPELTDEEIAALKSLATDGIRKADIAPVLFNVSEQIKSMHNQMQTLSQQRVEPVEEEQKQEEAPPKALEDMSREELVHFIRSGAQQDVGKLEKKVETLELERRRDEITRQVTKAQEDHPDFTEYMTEVKELLKQNPTMHIERAYQLAKVENPDKAQRIDAELKKREEKNKEEDTSLRNNLNTEQVVFGGLTPTSGQTRAADREAPMDSVEAAEDAWERTGMSEALAAHTNG